MLKDQSRGRWAIASALVMLFLTALPGSAWAITVTAAVLQGASAPGTGGGTFSFFGGLSTNASGAIGFAAQVSGGTSSQGVFETRRGVTSAAAVQGAAAPGTGTFSAFHDPSMNASGAIAFVADVSGGRFTQGVFLAHNGTISALAVQGSLAPGGETFVAFGAPSLNDGEAIAFGANVSGGTATQGVFVASSGAISAVAVQGSSVAGGGTFAAFSSPSLNRAAPWRSRLTCRV